MANLKDLSLSLHRRGNISSFQRCWMKGSLRADSLMVISSERKRNRGQTKFDIPSATPPLLSSIGLGWKALIVELYSAPPYELPDLPTVDHILEFASQQHVICLLHTRNKTRSCGFLLAGHNFVTVRQAEHLLLEPHDETRTM
jgi:hypothetical protein